MFSMNEKLQASSKLLEPSVQPEEAIVNLLLDKARRSYLKYQLLDRRLREKYGMSFQEVSKTKLMQNPSVEVEQDFFDWDMATTGRTDMKEEIQKLESCRY